MTHTMDSILIKDTTREERERIVAESIGSIDGSCDGCAAGLAEMYRDYIDGKLENCKKSICSSLGEIKKEFWPIIFRCLNSENVEKSTCCL